MTNRTYYYVSGNTANGFVNYLSSNIKEIKQIVVLQHPSNTIKTEIIKRVMDYFERLDQIEVIYSASGVEFLDGVIIRDKSLAIITDIIAIPELTQSTPFNLEKHLKLEYDNMSELDMCNEHKQKAYNDFSKGLKIHDRLEDIFISQMDFSKADVVADEFIDQLLKGVESKQRESIIYHRLFGTNTENGAINIVPELITGLSNRFYIKGRAGTGKSVFMKKVIKACEEKGLDMELYQCSFDPKSIDMVIVPALDFCMFDSTDPHEFFPERPKDITIDLYDKTVTQGTDEAFAEEIKEVTTNYKAYMKKGIENLKKAHSYQMKVEQKYDHINDESLNTILRELINKV